MSIAQQRTDLYTAVNAVANIGAGYRFFRYKNEWNTFLDLFKVTISGTPQIRGFMLEARGVPENDNMQFNPNELRRFVWFVHLFMGLSDANETEETFSSLVEEVIDALKTDSTLHAQNTYLYTAPAVTNAFEIRTFGDVLCHYAQIEISFSEFVA